MLWTRGICTPLALDRLAQRPDVAGLNSVLVVVSWKLGTKNGVNRPISAHSDSLTRDTEERPPPDSALRCSGNQEGRDAMATGRRPASRRHRNELQKRLYGNGKIERKEEYCAELRYLDSH